MTTLRSIAFAAIAAPCFAACAEFPKESLLFASANTWGLTIGASSAETGGGVTLGYKGQDLALIPAYAIQNDGEAQSIGADAGTASDSLSVFAQFGSDTPTSTAGGTVGLQKFFSTGMAAQGLANGFACRLALGNEVDAIITEYKPAECLPAALGDAPAQRVLNALKDAAQGAPATPAPAPAGGAN